MAPIASEHPRARARRQPFIATCSPDELVGQIIQTLLPRYNIDAPHLLALRHVVSTAIVAPKKPPTLKRTRPDKRIGEIGSIHESPRRSPYGPNGPPVSTNQSFFFHHQDPDFERLLPEVDRSRYRWPDEPVSESGSEGEEVSDNQESLRSMLSSSLPTDATHRRPASQRRTVSAVSSVSSRRRSSQRSIYEEGNLVSVSDTISNESAPTGPAQPSPPAVLATGVPTIVITSPGSTMRDTETVGSGEAIPFTLPRGTGVPTDSSKVQNDRQSFHSSVPSASPIVLQYTDTQDTASSTQQSEVFSLPSDFTHFTPPSQEGTEDFTLSHTINTQASEIDTNGGADPKSHRCSFRRLSSDILRSEPFEPALGKRLRIEKEVSEDRMKTKRSRSSI